MAASGDKMFELGLIDIQLIQKSASQVEEAHEMGVVAVKPCGDTTVELEFAETPFDEIALRIELFVVPVLVFCGCTWRE
jgi:hypothetical protein